MRVPGDLNIGDRLTYLPLSACSVNIPFSVYLELVSLYCSVRAGDVHSCTEKQINAEIY